MNKTLCHSILQLQNGINTRNDTLLDFFKKKISVRHIMAASLYTFVM